MSQTTEARRVDDLRLDAILPASLVHKRAVEQVFLTDWMEGPGDDICTLAAQLPLAHAHFSDGAAPFHDIVLIAEVVRQGGLVIASEILDVPADRQFLLRQLRVTLDPLEANRRGPDTQTMMIAQDPSSQIKVRRDGSVSGGAMRARLSVAGEPSGVCEVVGMWVPDSMYEGFRGDDGNGNGDGPPATEHAGEEREALTGKSLGSSVLTPLAPDGAARRYASSVIVDRDDPTFFDHPLDHVPGLLLMEALQQAAVAAACRELELEPERVAVHSFEMKFSRIAEFTPEIECTVELGSDGASAAVDCSQLGKTCCSGNVGLAVV